MIRAAHQQPYLVRSMMEMDIHRDNRTRAKKESTKDGPMTYGVP
jgi:hypothetical protein